VFRTETGVVADGVFLPETRVVVDVSHRVRTFFPMSQQATINHIAVIVGIDCNGMQNFNTFCIYYISKMYFSHWKPPGVSERMWSVHLDASISGEYQTPGGRSCRLSE